MFGLVNQCNFALSQSDIMLPLRNLKKSKSLTLKHHNHYLTVDHQPSPKAPGDRYVEDIPKQCLLKLKKKTLQHKFNIVHVPGVKNKSPDATSRHPTGKEMASTGVEEDHLSKLFMAGLRNSARPSGHSDQLGDRAVHHSHSHGLPCLPQL